LEISIPADHMIFYCKLVMACVMGVNV